MDMQTGFAESLDTFNNYIQHWLVVLSCFGGDFDLGANRSEIPGCNDRSRFAYSYAISRLRCISNCDPNIASACFTAFRSASYVF